MKQTKFQEFVRENRFLLRRHFSTLSVWRWQWGEGLPSKESAVKMSKIKELRVSLNDIPFREVVVHTS